MISNKVSAVNLLNLYTWAVIKANTPLRESDYGGKVPINPGGSEPDFTNQNKPYLTFGTNEEPSNAGMTRSGVLVYAIYGTRVSDIQEIVNILSAAYESDDTARNINDFTSRYQAADNSKPLIGISFRTADYAYGEGAMPVDEEGGREAATLTIRYSYVIHHNVVTTV